MREIKFRAWDEQKKIMHGDFEFIRSGINNNDWIVFKSDKQPLNSKPHPLENPYFQQQLKIMQYTGLKDKNGREIYEGDIVVENSTDEKDKPEIVAYAFNEWCEDGFYSGYLFWSGSNNYEVIGNIYENPELLEAKP